MPSAEWTTTHECPPHASRVSFAAAITFLRLNGALTYPSPCAPPLQRGMWAGSSSTTTTIASNDYDPWRTTPANNAKSHEGHNNQRGRWQAMTAAAASDSTTSNDHHQRGQQPARTSISMMTGVQLPASMSG
ncbi:hypothetical protein BJ912DRAFT_929641 [Pholiota molesta]|nr:hypothetical protein BJ912DRAFT_929641 [Pholiota molesta]